MPHERVTVTLPADIVEQIDTLETNRSRFVQHAVRREIQRRRRELLRESLRNPHPEALALAETGFDAWAKSLPGDDVSALVDPRAGRAVHWDPKRGWVPGKK